MRAKLKIDSILQMEGVEQIKFSAVPKKIGYNVSEFDEDNTYAKYTPNVELSMMIVNPKLIGTFKPGQTFYVDFTPITTKTLIDADKFF